MKIGRGWGEVGEEGSSADYALCSSAKNGRGHSRPRILPRHRFIERMQGDQHWVHPPLSPARMLPAMATTQPGRAEAQPAAAAAFLFFFFFCSLLSFHCAKHCQVIPLQHGRAESQSRGRCGASTTIVTIIRIKEKEKNVCNMFGCARTQGIVHSLHGHR